MPEPRLESTNLQQALLRSDRFRIYCVLGFVTLFETVYAVRVFVLGSLAPRWGLLAIAAFGFYELLALAGVNWLLSARRVPFAWMLYLNIFVEMCAPGLALIFVVSPSIPDQWNPLASQFLLTVFPLLTLSVLRLKPCYCYFGGVIAVASYFSAAYHHGWKLPASIAAYAAVTQTGVLVDGIIILFCAFVAGSVAREMRKYVETAVLEADTLFQARLEERIQERTRIARELHDTLLQSFQGLLGLFQAASIQLHSGPVKETLDTAIEQAGNAITEAREAVQLLRASNEQTDFDVAVRALGEQLATSAPVEHAVTFKVNVEGKARKLHPVIRDECYRITKEALRNSFHHASASQIRTDVRYGQTYFTLRITDDGLGIDAQFLNGAGRAGHYGLRGMRERAKLVHGDFEIWSKVGTGTEVQLSVPAATAYIDETPSSLHFARGHVQ